jgi:hypothetical protein
MENHDDTSLEDPQESDTDDLFPEPPPIPTIDLSSLMQPEYTPEDIEQIQIPEIPPPPPIPTIDVESFSFVPVDTAAEPPPPAAPPPPAEEKEEQSTPPLKMTREAEGERPPVWKPLAPEEPEWLREMREQLPSEEASWESSAPRRRARRPALLGKASITVFVLVVLLPMLCCCAISYIGD